MQTTPRTSEGFVWTPASGVRRGLLKSKGVIEPPVFFAKDSDHLYDVIVIGGGYAGLMAARETCEAGFSTLMLEARDRVGGRVWTAEVDGYNYEMGGTWVTHWMGYLQKEMERYGMANDLILTKTPDGGADYFTLDTGTGPRRLSLEEAGRKQAHAWNVFVNVDGQHGRAVCPLPHSQLDNVRVDRRLVEHLDKQTCRDRYEEIKGQLDEDERALLQSLLLHISGGNLDNSSLWDMVRSHALMGHSSDNFEDVWLLYKLRQGQSELTRRMFDEALEHGLDYSFLTPIRSISDTGRFVAVNDTRGRTYRARRVICTIPLNVLHSVRFEPPLSATRQEAIKIGHVNHMTKVHAEVDGKLAGLRACTYPGQLLYAYGDGLLPNGNTHIVAFGADERPHFVPEEHPDKVVAALKRFHPMEVRRMVFHNWNTDPYAQAGPAWWQPGFLTEYQEELQSRHGNVFFASADWAHGWRAAIDGALEQGFLNALEAKRELRRMTNAARSRDERSVSGLYKGLNGVKI